MKKRGQSAISKWWSSLATGLGAWFGMGYNATDPRRKLLDPQTILYSNRATANELLSSNLSALRAHCRNLTRNNPTARASVEAFAALLVGTGIALEPDTGDEATDARIRAVWNNFIKSADVLGRDLYCLQTEASREMPQAGEAIWRFVVDPSLATPENPIPVRVLALEGEWLVDEVPNGNGISWVAGIELDNYGRPVRYFLRNPQTGSEEQVDAKYISHIYEPKRPLQARGEPDFAPLIETMMNERDLVDAELYAAKQTAAMAMVITSENHGPADTSESGSADDPAQPVKLGGVARLYPGEDIKAFSHTRPSQMIAPFRQMLRGDLAAGMRVPQRFLDRDVGRANYSSMRADMLDTQRLLAPVREQFGHQTAGRLYRFVLPYLAMAAGISKVPRSDYRLIPDGQPYVDPEKDIRAAAAAITAGLSTHETEVGARGGDYRQVWAQLKKEQAQAKELGISMSVSGSPAPAQAPVSDPKEAEDDEEDKKEDELEQAKEEAKQDRAHSRAIELARASVPVVNYAAPVVNVAPAAPASVQIRNEIPAQEAPIVNVAPAQVKVAAPHVTVEAARAADAPQITVNVPQQAAPTVINQVSPTPVTIENTVEVPARSVVVSKRADGTVVMTPEG